MDRVLGVSMVDIEVGAWMALETIVVPASIARRLREEAEKLGLSPEEYLVELVLRDLDPPERAREYIEASKKPPRAGEGRAD